MKIACWSRNLNLVIQTNIKLHDYISIWKIVEMKKILVAAAIILVTASVNAQTGMPRELTCTEEAFNFSFSLGTKWKLSTPKMGPVDVTSNEADYIPAWSLKHNYVTPETYLPLAEKPLNVEALSYPVYQQNYAALSYYNSFSVIDKPRYLLPGINLSHPIFYKVLWPDFLVNSISYGR